MNTIFQMQNKVNFISLLKPIYLDKDIIEFLSQKCPITQENLQTLVNDLIRKDIEIARRVAL
jgi:hypothetical protein